jgi:hypothetical protein
MAVIEDVRSLGTDLARSYEARELVVDAWRMVVPKKLSRAYDLEHPHGPG